MQHRDQIEGNIYYVLEVAQRLGEEHVFIVSHSFLMKILEATARGVDIFRDPEKIRLVIDRKAKTYPWGGSFCFEI